MPANPYGVPITNNGAGQNDAQWVGTYERWMNDMMGMGWNINDIVKMAQDVGETFPKNLIATAHSKNALFPSANMLYEYDLDNHMRRSQPHKNADYPEGTGYGEWEPMTAAEQQDAKNYYAWRENPANYATIDKQYQGNAYNAYLAMNKNPNDPNPVAQRFGSGGNQVKAASAGGANAPGNVLNGPQTGVSQVVQDELARNMRLDSASQQFALERAGREYSEGRPIQNYLTDLYGQVMGVGFQRQPYSLSNYSYNLDPGANPGGGIGGTETTGGPTGDGFSPDNQYYNSDGHQIPISRLGKPGAPPASTGPINNSDPNYDPNAPFNQDPNQNATIDPNNPSGGNHPPVKPPVQGDPGPAPGLEGGVQATSAARPVGWTPAMGLSSGRSDIAGGGSSSDPSGQIIIPYDPHGNYNMPWADNPLNPYSQNYQGTVSGNNVASGDHPTDLTGSGSNTLPPTGTGTGTGTGTTPGSTTPHLPGVPEPNNQYYKLSNSFDPNNPNTWSLLAAPAAQQAGQLDAQRAQIMRSMPAGGERNLALAQATNQNYAAVGGLKQNLMGQSLTGLGNISQSKIWGQPMANSGAAGQLLSNATQQQGNNQQYDLGLKQIDAAKQGQKSSMWGSILGAIGGVAAGALISDIATKTDVKPFRRGLTDLRKVEPFEFTYNDEAGEDKGLRGISVMAQDLEKAIPEAVLPGSHKTIVPMGLLLTAVNALKELDKKVKKLEKERK